MFALRYSKNKINNFLFYMAFLIIYPKNVDISNENWSKYQITLMTKSITN